MSFENKAPSDPQFGAEVRAGRSNVRQLIEGPERDNLVISSRRIDGALHVVSRYGDDTWWLVGTTSNVTLSRTKIEFATIPKPFRAVLKAMLYRFMHSGSFGGERAGAATVLSSFPNMRRFLVYVSKLGITTLSDISVSVCSNYVQLNRQHVVQGRRPLKPAGLYKRLKAVSDIFHLSQHTRDAMRHDPWPNSSAGRLAGYTTSDHDAGERTPLIPDDVFVTVFQAAWKIVEDAPAILDLRDEIQRVTQGVSHLHPHYISTLRTKALHSAGFAGTGPNFLKALYEIRTACYIVIASLSGCRNHELTNLRAGSYYSSEDNGGERYWWMCSRSDKTNEGRTEWMIPTAAVCALKVLDRWAQPYQTQLRKEIDNRRTVDPSDLRIAHAEEHLEAVFIGADKKQAKQVRTLGLQAINRDLKAFARSCGLTWQLSSHQFRRTFANYAARSQFGDLRYLKEHFKHWSIDMTLGYALNESQEMALYLEVQEEFEDIKSGVVDKWLDASEPLAGGYGNALIDWRARGENIALFKSRAAMVRSIAQSTPIRSNGHAWCTADDNECVGNDLERTRCGDGCNNAVIGRQHAAIYQGLYDHLTQLRNLGDIGPGGRQRVERDIARCATVLAKLGYKTSVPGYDVA